IECLLEQLGLSALSAALHTHDDVFVHDGMRFLMVQGKQPSPQHDLHSYETQAVPYASPPAVAAAGRVLFYGPAAEPGRASIDTHTWFEQQLPFWGPGAERVTWAEADAANNQLRFHLARGKPRRNDASPLGFGNHPDVICREKMEGTEPTSGALRP